MAFFGFLHVGTIIVVGPLPGGLLCHWTCLIFSIFSCVVVVLRVLGTMYRSIFRWDFKAAKADEHLATCVFWFLGMVNGLAWITLLNVTLRGSTPNELWSAFGEHGGSHMQIANLGSVYTLGSPVVLLTAFMVYERTHISAIFYDHLYAMETSFVSMHACWFILSPLVPLVVWSAAFRTPVFTDLPTWPPVAALLAACFFANAPPYMWMAITTSNYRGPVFWLREGSAWVVSAGRRARAKEKEQ